MDAPLALYRRYRPETFAEVIGQEHVTEPLRAALVAIHVAGAAACTAATAALWASMRERTKPEPVQR